VHNRGDSSSSGSSGSAEGRVLATFLNEMDGVDALTRDGVVVVAATNRPSAIDTALLRPGRFDHLVYVPLPDAAGRRQVSIELP
jgi:SpoVK/Ycf46/Vps4 family AAA+-type ATPase